MGLESDNRMHNRLAPLQLIGACLIAGVIIFAAVAWLVAPIGGSAAPALPVATAPASGTTLTMAMLLRFIWMALALVQIPLAFMLRAALCNRAAVVRRGDPRASTPATGMAGEEVPVHEPTLQYFRSASMIGLALFESIALIGVLAFLFSADPIDLALVALPLMLMLGVFPTTGRWQSFDRAVHERVTRAR